MWNNVSTWLTSRRAGEGGAGGAFIVSRLIGGIWLQWQGENDSKCETKTLNEQRREREIKKHVLCLCGCTVPNVCVMRLELKCV